MGFARRSKQHLERTANMYKLILIVAILSTGCLAIHNPRLKKQLQTRASFDMDCSAEELNMTELSTREGMVTCRCRTSSTEMEA